ncbi:nitroreductase family deazaflavin-dependent oxidoreductase [Nocardia higoensis]|uniref:Nitroreductase family deazaflavin-dependent oxidoreductase n=1 Tax=Nocardia higoensis TaxID=228599 RepID=A0ABS0D4R6_9NOCA|nr:nitroreductase family deazaflavin-dependent oxidoreductase [Nocardia higoensis]MBF6353475.1 nitroreductase family deazaflavin-dependent oxidoreductase [Nocardia higoensis]
MRTAPLIMRLERLLRRVSGGRMGVLDLAGLPALELTVPGRKTGMPRTTALLYVPLGADFLVIGSNWGKPAHPMWSANLRAAETAVVHRGGERFRVRVVEVTGPRRKELWEHAVSVWPGYAMECERSGGREFRMFELRRAEET